MYTKTLIYDAWREMGLRSQKAFIPSLQQLQSRFKINKSYQFINHLLKTFWLLVWLTETLLKWSFQMSASFIPCITSCHRCNQSLQELERDTLNNFIWAGLLWTKISKILAIKKGLFNQTEDTLACKYHYINEVTCRKLLPLTRHLNWQSHPWALSR